MEISNTEMHITYAKWPPCLKRETTYIVTEILKGCFTMMWKFVDDVFVSLKYDRDIFLLI